MTDKPPVPGRGATQPRRSRYQSTLVLWSSAGVAMTAAVVWAVLVGHAAAQEPAPAGDPTKWRPLWDTLEPLFQHPRCLNCHGATNPMVGEEGINHAGGRAELGQCTNCHTARGANGQGWDQLAPEDRTFVGKDAPTICRQVKRDRPSFAIMTHAETDPLIGFAFAGNKAIDDESPFVDEMKVEPPGMTRDQFVNLLRQWITEAGMSCGVSGSIVYDLSQSSSRDGTQRTARGQTVTNSSRASERIAATVSIDRDRATGDLDYEAMESGSTQPYDIDRCHHIDERSSYRRGHGPAETTFRVELQADGSYTIRVELLPIQGTSGGQIHLAGYISTVGGCEDTGVRVTPERTSAVSPRIMIQISAQAQRDGNGALVLSGSKSEPVEGGTRVTSWTINID
jgi:hypothetical protein